MCHNPKFDLNFQNIFQNTKKKIKDRKKKRLREHNDNHVKIEW
jgi:hypothetical protein